MSDGTDRDTLRAQRMQDIEKEGASKPLTKMEILYRFTLDEIYSLMTSIETLQAQQNASIEVLASLSSQHLAEMEKERVQLKDLYRAIYDNIEKHGGKQGEVIDDVAREQLAQIERSGKALMDRLAALALAQAKSQQQMLNEVLGVAHKRLITEQSEQHAELLRDVMVSWQEDVEARDAAAQKQVQAKEQKLYLLVAMSTLLAGSVGGLIVWSLM